MALIEFDYIEIDGLLYPDIVIEDSDRLDNLNHYGILRLKYLHEFKRDMYREMLLKGVLADHCEHIDKMAFKRSERIQDAWLKAHPMPIEDTMERIRIRTLAREIADEIVKTELIYR